MCSFITSLKNEMCSFCCSNKNQLSAGPTSTSLSISHDSVFTPETNASREATPIGELKTVSIDRLVPSFEVRLLAISLAVRITLIPSWQG